MSQNQARALWFIEPYKSVIRESSLPEMAPGKIMVRTKYTAISPGTERLVYQGLVPDSMSQKMTVPYMEGDFSFPIKYGYSLVGEIVEGENEGSVVHMMHPHQDMVVVNAADTMLLSPNVTDLRASLISNVETCVNAIWDSRVLLGDRIVIVGFGAIGSLLAVILRKMQLLEITVVDVASSKIKMANNLGFEALMPSQIEHDSFDLAFHCSASASGLQLSIDAVGRAGKVIEVSWYGNKKVEIHLNTAFHIHRKRIISSQVSTIPEYQQARWSYRRRKQLVQHILEDPIFDSLITSVVDFEHTPEHFEKLSQNDFSDLSQLISYR